MLVFIVIGGVSRKTDYVFRDKRVLVSIACIMSAGALITVYPTLSGHPPTITVAMIGAILVGAATPLFYVEFVRLYLRFNLKNIILNGAFCTITSSALYLIFSILPEQISSLSCLLIPFSLLACLLVSLKATTVLPARTRLVREKVYIPWKLNFTALVQGMGFGAGRWFLIENGQNTWLSGSENILYVVGYVFAASLLIGFMTLMKSNFDKLIYKIGFSFMALGTLALVQPMTQIAGSFIVAFGYRFVDLLIWTLVIYLAISKNVTVNWLVGWSTACLYLGFFIGYSLISLAYVDGFIISPSSMLIGVSFAVLFSALVMTSSENEDNAWGSIHPSDELLTRSSFFDQAIKNVSDTCGFTERQRDVFFFLANGKTKREIAETLCLSPETIKVHMRNIYHEMDIHSQNDLIVIVEHEEEKLSHESWCEIS